MIDRVPRSLAVRLGVLYAVVFAMVGAVVFGLLYWSLANALDRRERAAVESWANEYAALYQQGGPAALRASMAAADTSPAVSSLFVRVLGADGDTVFARVPPDWIETQVKNIPIPGAPKNFQFRQYVKFVRIPRDAQQDFTVATRPLYDGRVLQVARSTDNRAALLAPLRKSFLSIGAIALGLAAVTGVLLAWRVTRPLRQVNETARRIVATGDLFARVPEPSRGGELSDLVRQFNTILSKNAALIGAQRETLDNLAHDLRTPLTRLRGTAELALRNEGNPSEAREALADCVEESERVLRLLESLLDVSAAETGTLPLTRTTVDVGHLVADVADLYREVAEEKRISLELDCPSPVQVEADSMRLSQAVANLVDNALKYTPEGGRVRVAARTLEERCEVEVTDSGPGVPVEERDKIWRRLYRGDASRSQRGLGLGLSLVKAIAEAHGGAVAVDDAQPGGGARFVLTLPFRAPA